MNKLNLIGYIAIVVIVISLANIGMELTGRASDTATVNVTIEESIIINFTTDFINFGSGRVNTSAGYSNATLFSRAGAVVGGNWSAIDTAFVLVNEGNKNVSVRLKAGSNASDFLGGTGPLYQYNVTEAPGETGSCSDGVVSLGQYYTVNATGLGTLVCGNLSSGDAIDSIEIDIKIAVPSDSLTGTRTDTFTALATTSP